MAMILESSIPTVPQREPGTKKVRRVRVYDSLYFTHPPDTVIKTSPRAGAFTYLLGSSPHETHMNRERALIEHSIAEAEARIQLDAMRRMRSSVTSQMKRCRQEVVVSESEDDSISVDEPEPEPVPEAPPQYDATLEHIAVLETSNRLLQEKVAALEAMIRAAYTAQTA
jgi:hypothetical protein